MLLLPVVLSACLTTAGLAAAAPAAKGRLSAVEYQQLNHSLTQTKAAISGTHLNWKAARAACAVLSAHTTLIADSRADCLDQLLALRAWENVLSSAKSCQPHRSAPGPVAIAASAATVKVIVCMNASYQALSSETSRLFRADLSLRSAGTARGFAGKCLVTLVPTPTQISRERSFLQVAQRLVTNLAAYLKPAKVKASKRVTGSQLVADSAALAPARQSWLLASIAYPFSVCPHA